MGLPLRLALAPLLLDVLPGPRVGEHPIQGDVVKRAVGPPVPSPVEAMPPALGRGGRDGGRAAHHGEGRQALQAMRVGACGRGSGPRTASWKGWQEAPAPLAPAGATPGAEGLGRRRTLPVGARRRNETIWNAATLA